MSRRPQIALAVVVALMALFLAARVRYAGRAPVKLPAENCDAELWKHINETERLRVIESCTVVAGRVVSLQRAGDGDLHIALDPDQKSVLNLLNAIHGRGHLAVEIICEHTPEDAADKAACGDFHPRITIPRPGDHVRITGAYVTDREFGWNEIHPVTRIEIQ